MVCTGSLSQKRLLLLEGLKIEYELKLLKLKLEHGTLDENSFYCTEDALSYTLHMEKMLCLSLLDLLFVEGCGNCDNGTFLMRGTEVYLVVRRSILVPSQH